MEDISNEFHLEEAGGEGWALHQIHPSVVRYENRERQPGEPRHEAFTFENPRDREPLRFILTASGTSVSDILLELDGVGRMEIPVRLEDGEALVYQGGNFATLYSPQWQALGTVPMDEAGLFAGGGRHTLMVDALMSGSEGHLKMELRLWGEEEVVSR